MCCGKAAEGHGCGCGTKEMNWESYDKPSFKTTMMADGDGMAMPLIISMDTSGSTMVKYKEGVFDFDTINAQYRKVAISAISNLSPSEVVIFDHNMTVEQVFAGNEYDAVQFIRDENNLQPRNGTGPMSAVLEKVMGFSGNKLILTDADFSYHKGAEEPVVQEPDWIPAGDGRAIGQQDFAINLSPLHAETSDDEEEFCVSCQTLVSAYDVVNAKGGDVCLPCWSKQGGEIIDGVAYTQEEASRYGRPKGYRNAESFNAEEELYECSWCGKDVKKGDKFYFIDGAWTTDALCVSCKEEGDDKDYEWGDLNIEEGSFDAESRFDKLSNEIADEYEEKGMSPEKAQEVGDATAAKIGRAKYGKTGMRKMQKKGMKADMVGSPSPTFNEDIIGQEGPSADPTNQTFEAMRTLAPSSTDVTRARRDLKNSGYGDVIYDRYMVYRDGSSNKFYYTAVTEKDGKYYPMGAYGRIGYLSKLFNIYGKTENPRASLSTMDAAYRQCSGKEKAKIKKGYVDYTLQMAESFGSETLAEIEGPTAEATTGGLHAPSSFAMTWEDGTGQSSASIPPNEIAWAENVKAGEGKIFGIGYGSIAIAALGIFGVKKLMDKKTDTASGDDTKKAEKGCGCSKTVAKSETVTKHSEYSADRINPVEVEGQNDIRNAESISLPQPNAGPQTAHRQNNRPSLKLW